MSSKIGTVGFEFNDETAALEALNGEITPAIIPSYYFFY